MTSRYQWDINAQTKHAPTSAERRFAPVRALYATPPGFAFVFGAVPGVWGFESSLSTPSQAAPYGAPPPGYFIAPLRGSNLGSLTLAKFSQHHPFQLPIYRSVQLAASIINDDRDEPKKRAARRMHGLLENCDASVGLSRSAWPAPCGGGRSGAEPARSSCRSRPG